MALAELRHAGRIFGVQHHSVSQHHPQAGHGAVAVLTGATAHARGVVGGNAADLAGVNGSRVGPDFAAMRRQPVVDLAANDARAQAHRGRIGADLAGGKAFANQRQHAVGNGLPRQAGAGRAKSHRLAMRARRLQQRLHLLFGLHHGNHLWRQAVKAGVGAVGEPTQVVGDHLLGGQYPFQCRDQRAHDFRSFKRSRNRLGAGTSGVRLRVQAPCSEGDMARPRLMNQDASLYRPNRL